MRAAWFAGGVARFFIVPDWADGISDRTIFGKRAVDAPGSAMKSWQSLRLIWRIRWQKHRQAPYNIASSATAAANLKCS
jgi:hypothetical protein